MFCGVVLHISSQHTIPVCNAYHGTLKLLESFLLSMATDWYLSCFPLAYSVSDHERLIRVETEMHCMAATHVQYFCCCVAM